MTKRKGVSDKRESILMKLRMFLSEKRARQFLSQIDRVHSNPKAFVSMLAGNKSMSDSQKIQSLRTFIRKHGRRSSTLGT